MIHHEFLVKNPSGLHARPAGLLAETLKKYSCNAAIRHNGRTKNGKSPIGILALGIKSGTTFELELDGEDECDAFNDVMALVDADFYEGA